MGYSGGQAGLDAILVDAVEYLCEANVCMFNITIIINLFIVGIYTKVVIKTN